MRRRIPLTSFEDLERAFVEPPVAGNHTLNKLIAGLLNLGTPHAYPRGTSLIVARSPLSACVC